MYKAIFFDLDGTLVKMDTFKVFFPEYIKGLMGELLPLAKDAQKLKEAFWYGVKKMCQNDGTRRNSEVYWDAFFEMIDKTHAEKYEAVCDEFYRGKFNLISKFADENPDARRAIEAARSGGRYVVLATSPLLPRIAQVNRAGWVGLSESDFDIITDYDSESFCKPSPNYYLSLCERLGVDPQECLMIGNDEGDDMMGASLAGLDCYLVDDYLIENKDFHWEGRRGSFTQMIEYLESIK